MKTGFTTIKKHQLPRPRFHLTDLGFQLPATDQAPVLSEMSRVELVTGKLLKCQLSQASLPLWNTPLHETMVKSWESPHHWGPSKAPLVTRKLQRWSNRKVAPSMVWHTNIKIMIHLLDQYMTTTSQYTIIYIHWLHSSIYIYNI